MKKMKIVAICSLFAMMMVSCKPMNGPSFSYSTPDSSFDGGFDFDIDFSHRNTISSYIEKLDSNYTDEDIVGLIEILDSNDLCANKVDIINTSFNHYDYGQNDTDEMVYDQGNFDLERTFEISRDDANFSKQGVTTYHKVYVDENNVMNTIDSNGQYSLSCDASTLKINENITYEEESLNVSNELFLNDTNFENSMKVFSLNLYKKRLLELFKSSDYEESEKHLYVDVGETLTFELICEKKYETTMTSTIYSFLIKDGVIINADYEFSVATDDGQGYQKIVESEALSLKFYTK